MTAKKQLSKTIIINAYMDYVLEHGVKPASVYTFAKQNNYDEASFYKYFGSFDSIDKEIFKAFFENTLDTLSKHEDYETYGPREKLLSFYYTFFENLTANRSYVVHVLHPERKRLKALSSLTELKHLFGKYIDALGIEMLEIEEENVMKVQKATLRNTAWLQLLFTLKFWLDDSSASFEKTDILIEKSVNTSFELMNTAPLKSVLDLGKFLFKENLNIKS